MDHSALKTPTTVFTGFLGSGKTTIIMHLIDQLQETEQVVYIKNEIGEENVDGALLEGKHIKSRELLNGCICCTLVGPFASAVNEILDTMQPDRIIIEASGAADPSAIALMIDGHPRLSRDGIISIIDVANFEGYKDISLTARNQTKFTDLIVFNKIELVDLDTKRAVVGYVRELNTTAPILEAPNGTLPPALVFGVAKPEIMANLAAEEATHQHGKAGDEAEDSHHHLEIDGLESLAFEITTSPTQNAIETFFADPAKLPSNVFRIKAIIQTAEGKSVLLNRVGTRTSIEELPTVLPPTKLVMIGFHLRDQETELRQLLQPLIGTNQE